MKKKIIIGVFLSLILITVIIFIVGAISSYNYDITNHPDDKWLGFGAVLTLIVGGFVVVYELDLFYTVYYFVIKPKTIVKSVLNIFANVSLLLIFFTGYIAHFLYKYVAEFFREDIIILLALFIVYVVLRIVNIFFSADKASCEHQVQK